MTQLTLSIEIDIYNCDEQANHYKVDYSLYNGHDASERISKRDLYEFLKSEVLYDTDICHINYLADNYLDVIKDYLCHGK